MDYDPQNQLQQGSACDAINGRPDLPRAVRPEISSSEILNSFQRL